MRAHIGESVEGTKMEWRRKTQKALFVSIISVQRLPAWKLKIDEKNSPFGAASRSKSWFSLFSASFWGAKNVALSRLHKKISHREGEKVFWPFAVFGLSFSSRISRHEGFGWDEKKSSFRTNVCTSHNGRPQRVVKRQILNSNKFGRWPDARRRRLTHHLWSRLFDQNWSDKFVAMGQRRKRHSHWDGIDRMNRY